MLELEIMDFPFKPGQVRGLTVRPEPVEGWTVKPFMVRQGSPERSRRTHHERLNLILSHFKWKAEIMV